VNGINDYDGCPDDKLEFVDDRLVLGEHVLFNFDSAVLLESGQKKLSELVDLFRRTGADWKMLTVQGYTDDRGSREYNEDLGERRAEAVRNYLMSLDVPGDKIGIESFGELKPVVPDADTEAEHRQNRRVEFVIQR
jgi:OmpA-OmpF porin, OOP family